MPASEDPNKALLPRSVHASPSARAQLNIEDSARKFQTSIFRYNILLTDVTGLHIQITYQTLLGTELWEIPEPRTEIENLQSKREAAIESSTTQTTLEMARTELAKRKLEEEKKNELEMRKQPVKDSDREIEIYTLQQKTESMLEKLKAGTALQMAELEVAKEKLADERRKSIETKCQMAENLDEGMEM
jgi:hypothetical protein